MEVQSFPSYVWRMLDTSSNSFARRARLSTSAIALAVAVTLAAVAAVLLSAGDSQMASTQLERLISSSDPR